MAASYTVVKLEEMRSLLKSEKGWVEEKPAKYEFGHFVPKEHVFVWPVPECPGIVVKVYSSISLKTCKGRSCGSDAIRVAAVNTVSNKGWIAARRVHRVLNWRQNLQQRVLEVLGAAKHRFRCVQKGVS